MLIGEEPEVRPRPVPAVMMPIPEAIVRTPQQWRADTLGNRMWRGMDRRQNVRLVRLWPQEHRE